MQKSPFRYAGGKSYAKHNILPFLNQQTDYYEPFVGGGSVFFARKNFKKTWLNDIDSELIMTYRIIRDEPLKLIEILRGYFPSKELHNQLRKTVSTNEIETAAKYWYLNHTSFGGMMHDRKGTFYYDEKFSKPFSRWASSVLEASRKLQGVNLTNLDFETVIDAAVSNSILFLDPPYFEVSKDLYRHDFTENDHIRLAKCIKRNNERLTFVMTYDNHDYIKELYHFLPSLLRQQWYYSSKNFKSAEKKCNELLITNIQVPQQFSLF